ncbi:RNase adapter RapZ [Thermaurantiacus sp.]
MAGTPDPPDGPMPGGLQPRLENAPHVIVTGLSGAGKSTVLRAFEDAGFEAVDNLPLALLPALFMVPDEHPVAVGVDTRTRAFAPELLLNRIAELSTARHPVRLLFLDCADDVLARRFGETRRPHPLSPDRPVADGIAREREALARLRERADLVLETSDMSPHDLRRIVLERVLGAVPAMLTVTICSFGYSRGLPRDADLVFDVRFLSNPHWDPDLRSMDGREPAVQSHVEADPAFAPAFARILDLLLLLLPGYRREGRAYLTIAFGCTGGRHRSVAFVERVGRALAAANWPNFVVHRDLAHP